MRKNTQQGEISRSKCCSRENFRENLRNWTGYPFCDIYRSMQYQRCFTVVHRDCQVPEVFAFDEHRIDDALRNKVAGISQNDVCAEGKKKKEKKQASAHFLFDLLSQLAAY